MWFFHEHLALHEGPELFDQLAAGGVAFAAGAGPAVEEGADADVGAVLRDGEDLDGDGVEGWGDVGGRSAEGGQDDDGDVCGDGGVLALFGGQDAQV